MTVAITGGAGFIGTQLAILLDEQGIDFKILDIQPSLRFPDRTEIVDVCDSGALEKSLEGCSLIYHLAAEHKDDVRPVSRYHQVNVEGAKNVIDAARKHHIEKIIFTSTVAVYGLNAGESRETDVPIPFNEYGTSKLESEKIFQTWAEQDDGRRLAMIRLVATFGVGNRGNIYNLIRQIVRKRFIMIGAGYNSKSLAYVKNIAAFLEYCRHIKQENRIEIYNYADKPDYQMKALVADIRDAAGQKQSGVKIPYIFGIIAGGIFDVLAKITGKSFPISLIRIQKFCANTVVNADKAHATGFKAPYTLKDGLDQTLEDEFLK